MKRSTLITGAAVLSLVAGAGAAMAFGNKGDHGPMHGGPAMNFEEIDSDGDGKITPEEMAAHAKARFDAADTDGNGKLSTDEMKAAAEKRAIERAAQRAEHMAARMLERMDADKDGELSFDEMPGQKTGAERMFQRADSDGDGALSRDELAQARERFGKRHDGRKRWHD